MPTLPNVVKKLTQSLCSKLPLEFCQPKSLHKKNLASVTACEVFYAYKLCFALLCSIIYAHIWYLTSILLLRLPASLRHNPDLHTRQCVGFWLGLGMAFVAWIMQFSVFWLPALTGNMDYGHGVCIKLAVLDNHSQHHHTHKYNADTLAVSLQDQHSSHQQNRQPSLGDHSQHNHSQHVQDSPLDNSNHTQAGDDHCDICTLLAAVTPIENVARIKLLADDIKHITQVFWRYESLHALKFYYANPPSRAPPTLF